MQSKYKEIIAVLMLIGMLAIAIYTQIKGVHDTQGEILLHYWKEYVIAFTFGSIALCLMIKFK
ncbi:MAG: hypothetical protein ABUK13_05620 [Gammaproteobacteria bacterium]